MSDLYIINEVDQPCRRHIVIKGKDGIGRYANRELKDKYEFDDFGRATDLEKFGFEITIINGNYHCRLIFEQIATYRDGSSRVWQDLHNSLFVIKG